MTEEEKEGVKMIQFLQGMAGIKEAEKRALSSWRGFSDWEKKSTKEAYALFSPKAN